MLRNTIIFTIQCFEINVITTIILESMLNHIPCITIIVTEQSFDVFKDENLWLAFLDYTGKLSEQSATSIIKPLSLSNHGERLARSTTN